MFTGSESSGSVQAVITKSNALTIGIIEVQLTFSSISATGRLINSYNIGLAV